MTTGRINQVSTGLSPREGCPTRGKGQLAASSKGLNSPAPVPRRPGLVLDHSHLGQKPDGGTPGGPTPSGDRLRYTSRGSRVRSEKETRVSLRIPIRPPTGRPAQADTCDGRESSAKRPRDQPGTHTSTGPRPRGFRQNIVEHTDTDGDRLWHPDPAGGSPNQLRSPRPSALDHASQ